MMYAFLANPHQFKPPDFVLKTAEVPMVSQISYRSQSQSLPGRLNACDESKKLAPVRIIGRIEAVGPPSVARARACNEDPMVGGKTVIASNAAELEGEANGQEKIPLCGRSGWLIELLFKELKSFYKLDVIHSDRGRSSKPSSKLKFRRCSTPLLKDPLLNGVATG